MLYTKTITFYPIPKLLISFFVILPHENLYN